MSERSPFEGIHGIVLDAVGTLIEPRPSVSVAYALAAARQGVRVEVDAIRDRFRRAFTSDESLESLGPLATDEPTERLRWRRIVSSCLPEVPDPDLAFSQLWDHFGDPSSWSVFPDVPPGLPALRALGLKLCIASNFDARLHRVLAGLPRFATGPTPWSCPPRSAIASPTPPFMKPPAPASASIPAPS